jgi:hypothetical protein
MRESASGNATASNSAVTSRRVRTCPRTSAPALLGPRPGGPRRSALLRRQTVRASSLITDHTRARLLRRRTAGWRNDRRRQRDDTGRCASATSHPKHPGDHSTRRVHESASFAASTQATRAHLP